MKFRLFVPIVAAVLAASASARAEDARAIIEKAQERLYDPRAHGLKDLSAKLVLASDEAPGAMGGIGIAVYWKAPDRKACTVDLPPEMAGIPAAAMIKQSLQGQMAGIVRLVVPERISENLEDYDYAASADGNLTKVTGKRKAGVADPLKPEEIVIWLDKGYAIVKMASTRNGQKTEMADLKFEEKDGKLLLSEAGSSESGREQSMKLEYQEVAKIWLLSAVHMKGADGKGGTITVKDVAVNKGLDDAVFAAPAEAAPGGVPGAPPDGATPRRNRQPKAGKGAE